MSVPTFAPGTACGGVLTSSQVSARQAACTDLAIARMQNPQQYRQWREAIDKQHRTASASAGSCLNPAKWLVLITLIVGACISLATHPMLTASSFSSAAEELFPVVPYSHVYSSMEPVSVVSTVDASVPHQSVVANVSPEFHQELERTVSIPQWQELDFDDSDNHTHWLYESSQFSGSAPTINWALEDSLLKAAELESNLASMRQENQQLSAHLLHAARQLAAVGQAVQLPQAQQHEGLQSVSPRGTMVTCMLLLMLTWPLWAFLRAAKPLPTSVQQPPVNKSAAEQVISLQQHNSKLEQQVKQQQQQLMHAEQTIMGVTSSKAQVEVQLRGSQQKISVLQSDLARAECLLDSHAMAKMKLPLFPMSPLAAPPVRHDRDKAGDKENCGRPAKTKRHQEPTPASAKVPTEKELLLEKLRNMEAEKSKLEVRVASLQADQEGLKDACRQADERRTKLQLDAEALELRVFTTHEQLALAEEKQAELAAEVQQAKQIAAAAEQALAASDAVHDPAQAAQEGVPGRTAHLSHLGHQPNQRPMGLGSSHPAEQAGLQRGEAAMQDPHVAAAAVPSATADSQPLSINPTTTAVPSDHVASPSTAVVETATAAQCSSPGALQPILTCRSNSCDMATAEGMSRPAAEAGHLIARQSGLQVSGRASSMQSSPIYGLATDGSQTFTPTRGPTAQMPRQGPKTPWSADWVTAFFSPGRSTLRRQRPGSISPTRLFDFNCNGDNTLPEPEDLFKTAWQGQAK
ncbi:hypothetical protein ABBQ32_011614 [Trebouxia sp. C0010 RCD-2024]